MSPEREAQAALYRHLGAAFRYPDEQTLASLRATQLDLEGLASLEGFQPVAAGLSACRQAQSAAAPVELCTTYTRLFVGPEACVLNEGDFRARGFDRPQMMADVVGFYRAFGVDPAVGSGERADFIGTELEFMCLLHVKEGLAVDRGLDSQSEVCRDARQRFVEDHLSRWVPDFCSQLQARTEAPFYAALARTLGELLALERELTLAA